MSLRDLSARIGGNAFLVQDSNGNTSIKLDGILWIKASGRRLSRAIEEDFHIPLPLAMVRDCIDDDLEIPSSFTNEDWLRPSVETPTHAVIPHRVVIHVHSINSIAWAIRLDGPEQLSRKLDGLHWQWIPYTPSGNPLAREIRKAISDDPETDIFILANHGLVVCGDDCQSAENLLRTVEHRLAITPRVFPKPNTLALTRIANTSKWRVPDVDCLHALGTDALSCAIVKAGVLYPCQALLLGKKTDVACSAGNGSQVPFFSHGDQSAPFIAIEGWGVMLNEKINEAQRQTLIGLARVAQRVEEPAQVRYLNEDELADVLTKGRF